MLLLIDAGNTNIKICLYDDGVKELLKLKSSPNTPFTVDGLSGSLYGLLERIDGEMPEGAVISSVVNDVTSSLSEAVRKVVKSEPLIVDHTAKTGLTLLVKRPEETGADRLANAAAANRLYKGNKIVIDFGTATTFSVITEDGRFMGGVIMPGLDISADALTGKTSKLPELTLEPPAKVMGDSTTDAMLSGIIIGHAGAVEKVLQGIENETGMAYTVVMTGGRADMMTGFLEGIDHIDPELTFKGLKIIYELN